MAQPRNSTNGRATRAEVRSHPGTNGLTIQLVERPRCRALAPVVSCEEQHGTLTRRR
jgi:hypothetical protein